jgi:hypothetical protein
MQGLCKQNFDPFKKFLGSLEPEFFPTSAEHQETSILKDITRVTIKFLNFSGLSKNNEQ